MTENPDVVNAIRAARVERPGENVGHGRAARVEAAVHPEPPLTAAQQSLLTEMQTPGSVLHGLLSWRSDSVMLARLRPVFMDLIALSVEVRCARQIPGGNLYGEPCGDCEGCRLHEVVERIQSVAKP